MICERCKKETKDVKSCIEYVIEYEGGIRAKPFRYEDSNRDRCFCHAEHGGYHHLDCPEEKCPACEDQLISCECSGKFVFLKKQTSCL